MRSKTAWTIKGFIKAMEEDIVGWLDEVIGSEAYQLYRLLEHPGDIPEDKK